jgi:uncharacterized protein
MTRTEDASDGSDVGRRITQERTRAGMSVEQTAAVAGMAAEYIKYVETSAAPNVSQATLIRLAAAFGVTTAKLAGAGPDQRPPRQADSHLVLTEMTPTECQDHLAVGRVGRVVFDEPGRGPVAIPAEYTMDGNDVIIRSIADVKVAAHAQHGLVSFDVDHFDDGLDGGWSVLLTGTAAPVTGRGDLSRLSFPEAAQCTDVFIRLNARRITGRHITAANYRS